jgi:signal transduction histidine kinase
MNRRTGTTSIKTKTTWFVVLSLGVLIALIGIIQYRTSLNRIEQIEEEQAIEHIDRVTRQLANSIADVGGTNNDWAYWDASYEYVQDGNLDYQDENLYAEAFAPLGVDIFAYLDTSGTVVAEAWYTDDDELPLPDEIIALGEPGGLLSDFTEPWRATPGGVFGSGDDMFLVTGSAILQSDHGGPPAGVLLMGRQINEAFTSELAELTNLDMVIERCSAQTCTGLSSEPQITKTSSSITANATLNSIDGTPILQVQVSEPRTMYSENLNSILRVLAILIAVGIIAVIITIAGLRRLLIDPLERLGLAVDEVARTNDPSIRAEVDRTDEIGDLAGGMNIMLARLENSQRQLLDAKTQIEGASEAKSRFLARVSHELRTPLNGVLAYAQLLQLEHPDGESGESVEQIIIAARHITALVDEFLDIARIEAGAIPLTINTVTASTIATEVVNMTQPLASAQGVRVDVDDPGHGVVLADAVRLRQVLLNLVSNAIKYGETDEPIAIVIDPRGPHTAIQVIDHGPGIQHEDLDRLFVPFDRLNADRTGKQGSGVGLSVAKQLVELMDGSIDVTSEVGTGTTFTVTLPAPAATDDTQPDNRLQAAGNSSRP